jgi:hypothetical protein
MEATLDLPPLEVLNDRFKYDPETGILSRTRWGWGPCGYLTSNGYLRVKVNDTHYRVHRIVWKIYYGEDPLSGLDIDHINRDKTDNRISNLRLATRKENINNTIRVLNKKSPKPLKTQEELAEIRRITGEKCSKPIVIRLPSGEEKWYPSVGEAARTEKINNGNLSSVLTGRYKSTQGYTARYA